jgi:hypothetical protein
MGYKKDTRKNLLSFTGAILNIGENRFFRVSPGSKNKIVKNVWVLIKRRIYKKGLPVIPVWFINYWNNL